MYDVDLKSSERLLLDVGVRHHFDVLHIVGLILVKNSSHCYEKKKTDLSHNQCWPLLPSQNVATTPACVCGRVLLMFRGRKSVYTVTL